ncbi:hypothetical protein BKA93DRAFT_931682 [Sparassis latifolia]
MAFEGLMFYDFLFTTWANIMTAILTCRFMLDLREAATPADPTGLSQLNTLVFARSDQSAIPEVDEAFGTDAPVDVEAPVVRDMTAGTTDAMVIAEEPRFR